MGSLYRHPEVYATLLFPEPEVQDSLDAWIDEYLSGEFDAVMDPACGPATWLLPFAEEGCRVAGNDLEPRMLREARRRLARFGAELTQGDMRRLRFTTGPFDVALNLSSSIGHLPDDAAVCEHLASVRDHLRTGGLYFLGLVVLDGLEARHDVMHLYDSEPLQVPSGGMAAVRYESVGRDPVTRRERIRLVVLAHEVRGMPPVLHEEYDLLTFPAAHLRALLAEVEGLDLVAVHSMSFDEHPEIELTADCGDVVLILRRR